jgi:hypothetical protein
MADDWKVWTISELLAEGRKHRDWGPWRLRPSTLCIELHLDHRWCYEIDLERCLTSAATLDWIFQIAGKRWAEQDPAVITGLVYAFDDVLHPQATLCSGGQSKTIPKELVAERVAKAADQWPDLVVDD